MLRGGTQIDLSIIIDDIRSRSSKLWLEAFNDTN